MPSTEIDDIFASKSKSSHAGSNSLSSKSRGKGKAIVNSGEGASTIKKKRKEKKDKTTSEKDKEQDASTFTAPDNTTSASSKAKRKRAEPETILDPSVPAVPTKKLKTVAVPHGLENSGRTKKIGKKNLEDEGRFRDSRGTGPRQKTEEGFSVYKEDELGIGDEGGDTPLCPFDCDCCF